MRSGRRWPVVLAVSLALIAAACGSSGSSTTSPQTQGDNGKPVVGGSLTDYQNFAAGDVPHIDPGRAEDVQGSQISILLFDGLADYDYKTGDLKPAVAESWSSNADASVWTFKLKKDVKWSDGSPVLPSDFKYAWERLVSPQLASVTAYHVTDTLRIRGAADVAKGRATEISGLRADDTAMTLSMELEAPLSFAPAVTANAALSPVPKRIVASLPDSTTWEQGLMVGNGPYKLAEPRKADQYIKLVRNETYYGGIYGHKAYLDSIDFRVSKDQDSAWGAFQAGQGQIGRIPAARYGDAKARYPGRTSTDVATNGISYYAFNDTDAVVGGPVNAKLRQAISLAIDRDRIVRDIFNGARKPATGVAMPGIPGFEPGLSKYGSRDVPRAKQLVSEWERDSSKTAAKLPAIKIDFVSAAGSDVATIVQANLQEIGIKADLDPREGTTYLGDMRAGQGQFLQASWIPDYNVYDNQLYPLFHSSQTGAAGNNFSQYKSPKFDGLIDQARRATDTAKANQLDQDAESVVLNDDTIVVPIAWFSGTIAWGDQVHNVVQGASLYVNYEDMWLANK